MKEGRPRMRILLIGLICCLCSGCATVITRSYDSSGWIHFRGAYPATRFEADIIGSGSGSDPLYPLFIAGSIIDLPLSVVFDTLLLPYDLLKEN